MTGDGVNDAPAEEGRLRHRCFRRDGCGARSSVHRPAGVRPVGDYRRHQGEPAHLPADEQLCHYRIAETLRVLLFMTLSILVFNFYPVTAVMIVMFALLNDGAILSIAYDNVHTRKPRSMEHAPRVEHLHGAGRHRGCLRLRLVLSGERVFHLDRDHIQTLMYLKLSVAGHLTIFLTRTRGPFWSIRPARILWVAVVGTQTVATLIAVYGLFMTPLGWGWAGFVWGYAWPGSS